MKLRGIRYYKLVLLDALKGIGSIGILIYLDYYKKIFTLNIDSSFFSTLATISGTLAGFVLVGMSIIYTLPNEGVLQKLKRFDSFKQVYLIYHLAFSWSLITMVLSLLGWSTLSNHIVFGWILLLMFIISAWFIYRCFWILKNIIDLRSVEG